MSLMKCYKCGSMHESLYSCPTCTQTDAAKATARAAEAQLQVATEAAAQAKAHHEAIRQAAHDAQRDAESAQRSATMAANLQAAIGAVNEFKRAHGPAKYAMNYYRLFYAFRPHVYPHEWREFFRFGAHRDLPDREKQLCLQYNRIFDLQDDPSTVMPPNWFKEMDAYAEAEIKRVATQNFIRYKIPGLLVIFLLIYLEYSGRIPFIAFLAAGIVAVSFLRKISKPLSWESPKDQKIAKYRGIFESLPGAGTTALKYAEAVLSRKSYIIDALSDELLLQSYAFETSFDAELRTVEKKVKALEVELRELFKLPPRP